MVEREPYSAVPEERVLLPRTRALLEHADEPRRSAAGMSATEAVRLGYVNWRPPDLTNRTSGVAQLRVDAWVLPSHTQASRVADGTIDLAICWVQADDLASHDLDARLIGVDRLYAIAAATSAAPVQAKDTLVLLDADTATWSSWNRYAAEFARHTGASVIRIDDGGITGPAFFDHARRLRRPVINSPKGQTTPVPPDLVQRPVIHPSPYWTWSLVSRRAETRTAVRATIEALTHEVGPLGLDTATAWIPAGDPYRITGAASQGHSDAVTTA